MMHTWTRPPKMARSSLLYTKIFVSAYMGDVDWQKRVNFKLGSERKTSFHYPASSGFSRLDTMGELRDATLSLRSVASGLEKPLLAGYFFIHHYS